MQMRETLAVATIRPWFTDVFQAAQPDFVGFVHQMATCGGSFTSPGPMPASSVMTLQLTDETDGLIAALDGLPASATLQPEPHRLSNPPCPSRCNRWVRLNCRKWAKNSCQTHAFFPAPERGAMAEVYTGAHDKRDGPLRDTTTKHPAHVGAGL